MNYLVDSDWLIDASIGIPTAVRLLDHLRDEGLAISIISNSFEFQSGKNAAFELESAEAGTKPTSKPELSPADDADQQINEVLQGIQAISKENQDAKESLHPVPEISLDRARDIRIRLQKFPHVYDARVYLDTALAASNQSRRRG